MGIIKNKFLDRTWENGVAISIVHLGLTLGLTVYTFSSFLVRFDQGVMPSRSENFIAGCAEILMQPMKSLYDAIPINMKTDIIEWCLMLINSLIWGFAALFLWRFTRSFNLGKIGNKSGKYTD